MNERKPAPFPPPPVAGPQEEEWEDDGDRPTRSIPAAVLAEIYQRPPSSPPPASNPASVPTNGLERMIITDAMLGRASAGHAGEPPGMPTRTVKMTTMPAKPEKKG